MPGGWPEKLLTNVVTRSCSADHCFLAVCGISSPDPPKAADLPGKQEVCATGLDPGLREAPAQFYNSLQKIGEPFGSHFV
jgi:hypothetical protein